MLKRLAFPESTFEERKLNIAAILALLILVIVGAAATLFLYKIHNVLENVCDQLFDIKSALAQIRLSSQAAQLSGRSRRSPMEQPLKRPDVPEPAITSRAQRDTVEFDQGQRTVATDPPNKATRAGNPKPVSRDREIVTHFNQLLDPENADKVDDFISEWKIIGAKPKKSVWKNWTGGTKMPLEKVASASETVQAPFWLSYFTDGARQYWFVVPSRRMLTNTHLSADDKRGMKQFNGVYNMDSTSGSTSGRPEVSACAWAQDLDGQLKVIRLGKLKV